MNNLQKIKRILDGGNHVKVECRTSSLHYTRELIIKELIIYDLKHDEFITNDDDYSRMIKTYFDDVCDFVKIEPIYKKPSFKVGDVVDVCEDYKCLDCGNKKLEITCIDDNKDGKCGTYKNGKWYDIPFWAMSHNIEDTEEQNNHIPLRASSGSEWSKNVIDRINYLTDEVKKLKNEK